MPCLHFSAVMTDWTDTHRAFAMETFKNNGSVILTEKSFKKHFKLDQNASLPSRNTIKRWVKNFKETGSAKKRPPTGRPRTIRSIENVEAVRESVLQSPSRSARKHAIALSISDRSVRRILHADLKLHPYKIQSLYVHEMEVEVCIDSLESAVNACKGGCTRLELCSALSEGGLTPTPALLRAVRKLVSVPVFCMVRCRGGSMVYSSDEAALMLEEAADLVAAGADGIVFGALTVHGDIDVDLCLQVKKVCGYLPCTFHRAFDLLADPVQQLSVVQRLGYSRVLTSGGQSSAVAGSSVLKQLVQAAAAAGGGGVAVMAGAGIKSSNVGELVHITGVSAVHASARSARRMSGSERAHQVNMGSSDDTVQWVTDPDEVRAIVSALAHDEANNH